MNKPDDPIDWCNKNLGRKFLIDDTSSIKIDDDIKGALVGIIKRWHKGWPPASLFAPIFAFEAKKEYPQGACELSSFVASEDVECTLHTGDLYGAIYWEKVSTIVDSVQKTSVADNRFPNSCPRCGGPAYVGISPVAVDCKIHCSALTASKDDTAYYYKLTRAYT